MTDAQQTNATPVSQTNVGTPVNQAPGSNAGSVSVFGGAPGWRGKPNVSVKNVGFIGNFAAGGFTTAVAFQGKKPLDVQPLHKPLLGQFGIGQPAVLAPVNPRPVNMPVAPLQPMTFMPGKMVLPTLSTQVPNGQILKNNNAPLYCPEPDVISEAVEPDQLEQDMTNGDVVGDFPENFSAEQEGEEEHILETEKQMEEEAEKQLEADAVAEAERLNAQNMEEEQREDEREAVEAAVEAEEAAEAVEEQAVEDKDEKLVTAEEE